MALFKRFLFSLLAILLLFEEWLWDALTALGRALARWLRLERAEAWLRRSPRYIAALAFLVPVLIVTPLNLIAFWMMGTGKFWRGLWLEIAAKLLGTVLIARVFALTKPQLMTFGWFQWLYTTISGWLHWAHERIRQTATYKAAKRIKQATRLLLQRLGLAK